MSSPTELPLSFRFDDVSCILKDYVVPGESCSLVGVGSVGKSNLLRFLSRPDVIDHHRGEGASDNHFMLLIDPNLSLPVRRGGADGPDPALLAWQGYEQILHRLYQKVDIMRRRNPDEFGYAEDGRALPYQLLHEQVVQARTAIHDGGNPLYAELGIRQLEYAFEIFFWFMPKDVRVVVMIDEFEELLSQMPIGFFQSLRGLRDNFKYNLMYLTFTRAELPQLVEKLDQTHRYESFIELFKTDYISFYNRDDTRLMLKRLGRRHGVSWPSTGDQHELVYLMTLGHAGLVRAVFHARGQVIESDDPTEAAQHLMLQDNIVRECETIWLSVSEEEQAILEAVAKGDTGHINETSAALIRLQHKHLLVATKPGWQIEPPLFRVYLQRRFQKGAPSPG